MDDEDYEDDFMLQDPNKKHTFYMIDGGEHMFEGGNDCHFRKALQAVYNGVVRTCCTGSQTFKIGVVIYNTKKKSISVNAGHCYDWIPMGHLGQSDVIKMKELLDSDDIKKSFIDIFDGHHECDMAELIYFCQKTMNKITSAKRHESIIFLTNQINPFDDDEEDHFKRFYRRVEQWKGAHESGKAKKKTQGDITVILLRNTENEEDLNQFRFWKQIDEHVIEHSTDNLADIQSTVYKKTFNQRAFSNISFELCPGLRFNVGVYVLSGVSLPPKKIAMDSETNAILERRQQWKIDRDESNDASNKTNIPLVKADLRKMIRIGGESIINDQKEMTELYRFDAKGIVLLGFRPIESINWEDHVQPSRFLFPNDSSMIGSVRIYRALLLSCTKKKMAMICRFCSRSNQQVRLVALIPKMNKIDDDGEGEQQKKGEDIQEGFHVVFLPFAEDIRDIDEKRKCPIPNGEWPAVSDKDVNVMTPLVKRLTASYAPDVYLNPRIQSFYSMLIEHATCEKIEVEDCILPYHMNKNGRDCSKVLSDVREHFHLADNTMEITRKRGGGDIDNGKGKKQKGEDMDLKTMAQKGMLNSLTVAELKEGITSVMNSSIKQGTKKADLIEIINKYYHI